MAGISLSNLVERGDYVALQHACITRAQLYKVLHIWLLDNYTVKPYASLARAVYRAHGGLAIGTGVGCAPCRTRRSRDVLSVAASLNRDLTDTRTGWATRALEFETSGKGARGMSMEQVIWAAPDAPNSSTSDE
jgi:hypothetical protein